MWILMVERSPTINDRYLIKASFRDGEYFTVSSNWRTDKWGITDTNIDVQAWYEGLPTINVTERTFKLIRQGLLDLIFLPVDYKTAIGACYYIRSSFDTIILEVTGIELIEGISNVIFIRIV